MALLLCLKSDNGRWRSREVNCMSYHLATSCLYLEYLKAGIVKFLSLDYSITQYVRSKSRPRCTLTYASVHQRCRPIISGGLTLRTIVKLDDFIISCPNRLGLQKCIKKDEE